MEKPVVSERTVVYLIGAIQFINVLEFMMVMPLGPDISAALGIGNHHLGLVAGSYTAASALAGIVASTFIERFDRRLALAWAMAGLIVATAAAGLAVNLETLLLARVLAGVFGGPSAALSFAVIADTIPPERRGRAMGTIMSTFAMASVIGVPAGLELARLGGWRLPFFAICALGMVVVASAVFMLPPLRLHLTSRAERPAEAEASFGELVARPNVLAALLTCVLMMASGFLIVPNIAPFVQGNLDYPRENLGRLYLAGGLVSYVAMQIFGRLTDRIGAVPIAALGAVGFTGVIYFGFIQENPAVPVLVLFAAFMLTMSLRGVSFNTLSSLVPRPMERARFMSIQSSVQHLSSAGGALLSSQMLVERADRGLSGMDRVGWLAIGLNALMMVALVAMERQVKGRGQPPSRDEVIHSAQGH